MNNDVEPFEPGWLKEMVGLLGSSGAGAVGARLLYPGVTEHETPSGYAVQHRGVKFRKVQGEDYPRNLGIGEDALDEHLGEDTRCPATTAACLLIDRETFDAAGGFTAGYRYGSEDVDLGLKVLSVRAARSSPAAGPCSFTTSRAPRTPKAPALCGRTAPATGSSFSGAGVRNCTGSWSWSGWGRTSFWTEERPHAAITVTSHDVNDGYGDWYTAHEMGDALEAAGWRVSYVQRKRNEWYKLPQNLDYLLVLIDQYDISRVPPGVQTVCLGPQLDGPLGLAPLVRGLRRGARLFGVL